MYTKANDINGGEMDYISGEDREQTLLLPDSIEDYLDENNPVRVIDAYINSLDVLSLGFLRAELKETGRPPYNPKDLLKLYVYGYMNRIRSSRRLEQETKRNLEVLWLLGKLSPDHKTIARFRQEHTQALKHVFCDFVRLCAKLELYGKEVVAIDGSKFKAVNSRRRNVTEKQIRDKIQKITEKIDEYLEELERNDAEESTAGSEKTKEEIAQIISDLNERKSRYQGYANGLERTGEKQKSLTDGDSRLMTGNGVKMDVCYNVQTAVDAQNKLIVAFEVSNQCNDKNFITPMAEQTQEILEAETITVIADAGYESVQDILSAQSQGADVHVSGTDFDVCVAAEATEEPAAIRSHHNGRCIYLAERNIALCPMGNILYPATHKKSKKRKEGIGVYHNYAACQQCTCKCTTDARGRFKHQVPMAKGDFSKPYDDAGLTVKQIRIKGDKQLLKQRKAIVEHPFGTIKRSMDAGYCLTKGLRKVPGEFALTFLAYNFKRAINILGCDKLIAAME